MAKLKKLAILCLVALGMTTLATGCNLLTNNSSSTDNSSSTNNSSQVATYTVTVNAPSAVTISGTLTAEAGNDVTFTATALKQYVLTVTGAELVGEKAESTDKLSYVYTYKVAALSADTTVEITTADTPAVLYEKVESEALAPLTLVPNAAPIEVTLPLEQGNYYIELVSELAGDVKAGPASYRMEAITYQVLTEDMYDNGYTFYIAYEEADSTAESVNVAYNVYKALETGVTKTEGSATILSGVDTSLFFFTFPEAGVYKISTSEEVTFKEWLSYGDELNKKVGEYLLIETDTDYEVVEIIVNKESADTFATFDWSVEKVEPTAMTLGSNAVEQAIGDWVNYTFTATENGAYTVSLTGDDATYFSVAQADSMYETTYNNAVEFDLYENETVSVWVRYNGKYIPDTQGEQYATLAGNVSITKTGAVGDRLLDVYGERKQNYMGVGYNEAIFSVVANGTRTIIADINTIGATVSWYLDNPDDITVKYNTTTVINNEGFTWNTDNSYDPLVLTVTNNTSARIDVEMNIVEYDPPVTVALDTTTTLSVDPSNGCKVAITVTEATTLYFTFSNPGMMTSIGDFKISSVGSHSNTECRYNYYECDSAGKYVFIVEFTGSPMALRGGNASISLTASKTGTPAYDHTATLGTSFDVAIAVNNFYPDTVSIAFTASKDGSYTIGYTNTNAVLYIWNSSWGMLQSLETTTFTLTKGETYVFEISLDSGYVSNDSTIQEQYGYGEFIVQVIISEYVSD